MRQILLVMRNGAFAVVIAVGLAFGAAQALSTTPAPAALRPPCTSEPGTCPIPIGNCDEWCDEQGYYDGDCVTPPGCCVCRH